ncbi:LysR family transcriptional regulator [Tsuneonella sp. CC-YZS046]|uniref:LysR family transcriptional regulator n=1 Tax=Tsuneonella sp. CC-YZS046 TaxID=3042152 RepID=UPI002D784A23|nr:LysR family transcriptional regulator [Tsuneonella sp. CC-YZS046]WRO67228.1 LysR family transcriptional regulator [Tsuneonella sp. CC-YZS046]
MDIRHLRYFVAIADNTSLLKASEHLHIAQSSLSVHLANLEADLGVRLMDRNRKGVELTPAGKAFYEKARNLLRQYREMRDAVSGFADTPRGRVAIGMPSTTSAVIAGELYGRLADSFPEVRVYITDAGAGSIYEWLLDGRLDLAILFSVSEDSNLDVTPLYREEFCLVSHADHALPGEDVDFASIFDLPLVSSSHATTWRKVLDEMAERFGKKFDPLLETESVAVLLSILATGRARCVLPLSYASAQLSGQLSGIPLEYQRLVNPELCGAVSLVHLSSARLNATQQAVKDEIIGILGGREGKAPSLDGSFKIPVMRTMPTLPPRFSKLGR